jgi:hypothetical protein
MSPGDRLVPNRNRSTVEIAFRVVKTLATARILWPTRGAVTVEELATIADASVEDAGMAIALLCDEGVLVDRAGVVRLTERAAEELLAPGPRECAAVQPTRALS